MRYNYLRYRNIQIKVVPRQSRPYIGCDFFVRGDSMRKFEKISFNQFKEDVCDDKTLYEEYNLPKRGTKCAAGYDFYALYDYILKPGEIMKIRQDGGWNGVIKGYSGLTFLGDPDNFKAAATDDNIEVIANATYKKVVLTWDYMEDVWTIDFQK